MILLMHDKHASWVMQNFEPDGALKQFFADNHIPPGTPLVFLPDLPEADAEGNPIFAFSLSAGEYHYWSGRPLLDPKLVGRLK